MILVDEDLMLIRRQPGKCDWCGRNCVHGRDPAHILSKGAGRVDVTTNLLSLCRFCHTSSHAGNEPTTNDMLAIAAARSGILQDDLRQIVHVIRRIDPKAATPGVIRAALRSLKPAARLIAKPAIYKALRDYHAKANR